MIKAEYKVIGVMSGTSLDGIDLAYCSLYFNNGWTFKIHETETIAYSEKWSNLLKNLVNLSMVELKSVDSEYTSYLAETINLFIKTHKIDELNAVCSHGHTALHQPENALTYQIGNLPELAKLIGQTVICNFRLADVKLGGQGAPLVPIGDQLLFAEYDYCLNLGGFANISTEVNGQRIAYDICPVNIVLNHYVASLGFDYDNGGKIAASGEVDKELLQQLNTLSYYKLAYPKSLGLEWVNAIIFPLIDSFHLSTKDILRTFVEHVAIQISDEINSKSEASVMTTGGGAFNMFLMDRLSDKTQNIIIIPEKSIIEYKEALIFAFLGVLKLRNENNCLSSVTGALNDHSSGKIYHP